jgi:hypothetical protein
MSNSDKYVADKPISEEKEDRFQRYNFSKRIADTIKNRKSSESIVFGLFGAWGEGKSSVLNFIDKELQADDSIIRINLNPWRYSDEESLLLNFFSKISEALDKKLKNGLERFGEFVKKYGASGSMFGFDFSGIGKSVSDVELEKLKERVDAFLKESTNKIVIFVDDIDRLDKQEIYSLFRLVKLTADFSNTTYILSFDEAMVAAAIGDRFGMGDKKAGASFLEKIIQVPLIIPKAQPEALKKFCFEMVDAAILSIKNQGSMEEIRRFVDQFTTKVLPRLSTPRLAVRYGNTLSFSLPLLDGEVNTTDLMLIEAIKIFYPDHYQFIKENADYLVGSYEAMMGTRDNTKAKELKEHLNSLDQKLSKSEQQKVRDLLSSLFPTLDTIFLNYHFSDKNKNDWYVEKRIASPHYFDRYFSYAVIEGDISDVEFEQILTTANSADDNVKEIAGLMKAIIGKSKVGNFIQKLRSRENLLEWEPSVKIVKAVSEIGDIFPNTGGMLGFGFDTESGQASIFIYQVLKEHKEKNIFSLAKTLMTESKDFAFTYNLNNWLRAGDRQEDKLFNEDQYKELAKILGERALAEAGDASVFERFADKIHYLISTWSERDHAGMESYANEYLNKKDTNVLTLLKAFVPVMRTSSRVGEFKIDITKKQYDYIASYFDKNNLYKAILKNYTVEQINAEEPYWIDMSTLEFTELNMVRQFVKWYNKDKEAETTA